MISYVTAAARTYLGLTQEPKILVNRALLIPPALPGSLGDSAMISAAIAAQRLLGIRDTDLLYGKNWPLDESPAAYVEGERFFYRGSLAQLFKIILRLADYSHVGLIGADIIDGQYNPPSVRGRLTILAEAARLEKKQRFLGPAIIKTLKKRPAKL